MTTETKTDTPKSTGNKNPLTKQLKELRDKLESHTVQKHLNPEWLDSVLKELQENLHTLETAMAEHRDRIELIEKISGKIQAQLRLTDTDIPAAPITFNFSSTINPLLVVLPYCTKDAAQALTLLQWCAELQGGLEKFFPALLVADVAVAPDTRKELHQAARKTFATVRTITAQVSQKGWLPNQMFMWAAHYVRDNYRLPWLWLEPDCVPLTPFWLYDLALAYAKSPLRYLGAVIEQTGQPNLPARHLTGCSVYPNDAYDVFSRIPSVANGTAAWDIAGGLTVAEGAQHTPLIQHFWGPAAESAPVFVKERKPDSPPNHVRLDFLKPDAVLFHRTKDNGLIDLLREQRNGSTVEQPAQTVTLQD